MVRERRKGFAGVSYSEDSQGQVVLRMSREDYEIILMALGAWTSFTWQKGNDGMFRMLNRLNEGHPSYTPYQVPEKK
jgi:hypothetical protein